ncbi:MAG TPA: DUF2306 domain-containing protein [Terriglobales bacterium]|jgi:uncharacterized membrane protein|nr:DUF2306 domain-containing protein [Terriglobales bacterium]
MATTSVAVRPASRMRPKYALFALVGLMIAYVLVHNESFLVQPSHPVWQHYQPFRWWLLPHGLAGACAILLGPLQFSDRLRQRFTKFHRVVGRIYIFGALVAAPLGAYIQYFQERMGGPRSFSVAAVVDAVMLMGTTSIAFAFILNGKVQQHRQWMTRSFAVALVFLEVRVVGGLTGWDKSPAAIETIVWSCLAFSLLSADIVLQIQELLRSRPAAKVQVARA